MGWLHNTYADDRMFQQASISAASASMDEFIQTLAGAITETKIHIGVLEGSVNLIDVLSQGTLVQNAREIGANLINDHARLSTHYQLLDAISRDTLRNRDLVKDMVNNFKLPRVLRSKWIPADKLAEMADTLHSQNTQLLPVLQIIHEEAMGRAPQFIQIELLNQAGHVD